MALFWDLFAAATAAAIMLMGVAFVVMVMPAGASVLMGVAFAVMVMPAAAFVLMGVAFVVVVMPAGASVFMGVAFVVMVMPTAAAVIFFIFLVVCMLFGAMDGFLCLMAVAASAVMYMLFIVFFHGMSPYLEWKRCFLTGIILWCYFSILQRHRKWSMRNTLIFQVGERETIGLDRAKKNEFERGGIKIRKEMRNEKREMRNGGAAHKKQKRRGV